MQFVFLLIVFRFVNAQNEIQDEIFESSDQKEPSTIPPNPFRGTEDVESIDEKLDRLDAESQELVIDYVRNGRKLNGELRRRLILYVMKFSPVQSVVELAADPKQIQKIDKIKYRFRSGMKIKYSAIKSRIDRLVFHLLSPIFTPFVLLQQTEIRPLFAHQNKLSSGNQFVEPITVPSQQINDQQSSFTALEMFPSSMPQNKWPEFDARWLSPQNAQFSVPSYTPFYQPFQYYRPY